MRQGARDQSRSFRCKGCKGFAQKRPPGPERPNGAVASITVHAIERHHGVYMRCARGAERAEGGKRKRVRGVRPAPRALPPPTCTSSSVLTLLLASCSFWPPRWLHKLSISSMKIMAGATSRAFSNSSRTWPSTRGAERGAERGARRQQGVEDGWWGARGGGEEEQLQARPAARPQPRGGAHTLSHVRRPARLSLPHSPVHRPCPAHRTLPPHHAFALPAVL